MPRIAVVRKEDCNPVSCGGYLCVRVCPVNRQGEDCIKEGSDHKAEIDAVLCVGCGICPNKCPFDAIDIINLPSDLAKEPVHQYGRNGFHLFNLPVPIFGKVVGVVGVNGIGKSTAVKILAGVLKPNMGDYEAKSFDYNRLIEFYKGTEAQQFFEKVRDGKIKAALKPQEVEQIPRSFDGTVKQLLEKVDENCKIDEIAGKLELHHILDQDISKISGGELQRVAIAATMLKDANLYIFDEPTSYLDIKQRINISKIIRDMADENTAVLIIEHDLIILDYLTDLVHVMYGKETAYGVVSQPKTTRVGINMFLSGFLKEENMRFRDHEIKFENRPEAKEISSEVLCSWENIEKQLDKFKLNVASGEIKKHDVIGILGANATGKTSFAKILAKVIEPDKGKVHEGIKVAYKPQYIESGDAPVLSVLQEAIGKYDSDIIKPLNLERLFNKNLNQLSGGQLQRVAIARCLAQKADLYLLDEPSAYLDVEQRMKVSRVIGNLMEKRGTTCMVVDHDLLFIDYLSRKLIVFEGEPAKYGKMRGPFTMQDGMNRFLMDLDITFRRDPESNRPRANKKDSQMDRQQKIENRLYYL
ncbi:MAG: ribosome biogenesis/translation initiation ATPase RLI [Candidatus Nanoarchaeia archaeon]